MEKPSLNAAQVSAIEAKIREHVANVVKDVGLRQWAVEQALTHCARHNEFKDLQPMFEAIYQFVAAHVTRGTTDQLVENASGNISAEAKQ